MNNLGNITLEYFFILKNNACPLGEKLKPTNKQGEKDENKSLTAKPPLTLRHFTSGFVLSMLQQLNKYAFIK